MSRSKFLLLLATLAIIVFSVYCSISDWITPDSTKYLSMAKHYKYYGSFLVSAKSITIFNKFPKVPGYTTAWPIGLPFAIFVISKLSGANVIVAGQLLSITCYIISAFLVFLILRKAGISTSQSLAASTIILSSPASLKFYSMVLSEPLYITITLLSTYILLIALDKESFYMLLISSALTGAAFCVRYIGISFVIAFYVFLLFLILKREIKKYWMLSLIITLSFITLVIYRNVAISGYILGEPRARTLFYTNKPLLIIIDIAKAFSALLIYRFFPNVIVKGISFIIGIFLWLIIAYLTCKQTKTLRLIGSFKRNLILHSILYIIVYMLLLLTSEFSVAIDRVNFRFILPILPYIILTITCLIHEHKYILIYTSVIVLIFSTIGTCFEVNTKKYDDRIIVKVEETAKYFNKLMYNNNTYTIISLNFGYDLYPFIRQTSDKIQIIHWSNKHYSGVDIDKRFFNNLIKHYNPTFIIIRKLNPQTTSKMNPLYLGHNWVEKLYGKYLYKAIIDPKIFLQMQYDYNLSAVVSKDVYIFQKHTPGSDS